MRKAAARLPAPCAYINQYGRSTHESRHNVLVSINNPMLPFLPIPSNYVRKQHLAQHPSIRLYCTSQTSPEHLEDNGEVVRSKLLDSALSFVKDHGWTEEAIIEGVKAAGYSKAAHGMFKLGAGDLALHFYKTSNEKLYESLRRTAKDNEGNINIGQFIKDAIKERIRMTMEHQNNWHNAMAHLSHPYAVCQSLNLLMELVDEIWHIAGDKSTDMNWYTKRGLLASIYKASELFMLQDKSADLEETWKFIDRRFEDSLSASSLISHMNSFSFADVGATLNSAATVGTNLLGLRR